MQKINMNEIHTLTTFLKLISNNNNIYIYIYIYIYVYIYIYIYIYICYINFSDTIIV